MKLNPDFQAKHFYGLQGIFLTAWNASPKSLLLKDCQTKPFHLITTRLSTHYLYKFQMLFHLPWMLLTLLLMNTKRQKKTFFTFKGMFLGLFKFSAIHMWCFAYSFNHRIISTFNQLQITGLPEIQIWNFRNPAGSFSTTSNGKWTS